MPYAGRQGYLRIQFWKNGKRILKSIDNLMITHFRKNEKKEVNTNEINCPF
jgi:hypothetical protein